MNKKTITILTIILITLIAVGSYFFFNGNVEQTLFTIKKDTFEKTVEVSGKVVPIKDAHLGFETSGTIKKVAVDVGDIVKKGDILVQLDPAIINSNLSKAQANLQTEITTLNELSLNQTSTEVNNAKVLLIASLQNSYIVTDNAVKIQTDQFFEDSISNPIPEILKISASYNTQSFSLNNSIDKQRVAIETTFTTWQDNLNKLNVSNLSTSDIELTKSNLETILKFLGDTVMAANYFVPTNDTTQKNIDTYRLAASQARENVQNAYTDIIQKSESLRKSKSQIPVQQSKIISAKANVQNFNVQLSKTTIRAPFDGIVTKQDAQTGEIAQSGVELVSLIGSEGMELEVFIPEVNIAGIKLGQLSLVTLDAYGTDTVFEAEVVSIDPAETVKDGISTYKTTFFFKDSDVRIFSGMTADVSILIDKRSDVLLLPIRAIFKKDGNKYVYVQKDNQLVLTRVQTGPNDSAGNTEVIDGLKTGSIIILNPKY